jgi:hypothetical protein
MSIQFARSAKLISESINVSGRFVIEFVPDRFPAIHVGEDSLLNEHVFLNSNEGIEACLK